MVLFVPTYVGIGKCAPLIRLVNPFILFMRNPMHLCGDGVDILSRQRQSETHRFSRLNSAFWNEFIYVT